MKYFLKYTFFRDHLRLKYQLLSIARLSRKAYLCNRIHPLTMKNEDEKGRMKEDLFKVYIII